MECNHIIIPGGSGSGGARYEVLLHLGDIIATLLSSGVRGGEDLRISISMFVPP